jgi:hypothetical protein
VAAAALGGLLHRAGEGLALKILGTVEAANRAKLDDPSRHDLLVRHGPALAERLVRRWALTPPTAMCVLGWRRFGEFSEVSRESAAVYFGRLLANELLYAELAVPGVVETVAAQLAIGAERLRELRAKQENVRALVEAVC